MIKKLIPITLSALLLLSVSGCEKSGANDNITVMKPPSDTTTENTEAQESVQTDDEETMSFADPVPTEYTVEPDGTAEPVNSETADALTVEETEEPFGGYVKETYQDPGEFIDGIQQVVKESATVEEMYRAVEEFDTEGRIDKVLISYDGKPITEGRLVQGLWFEVYYDDETSWFNFQY